MTTASMLLLLFVYIFTLSLVFGEYPNEIIGPIRTNDRICIVGADFAGIHMALLLKEKGYTNIIIYEKEAVVGGTQTFLQNERGATHELGTAQMFHYDNSEAIDSLIKKYQFVDAREVVEPNVWVNYTTYYTFDNYILLVARQHYGGNFNNSQLKTNVKNALNRYQQTHRSLLGTYNGMIFEQPTWEVKRQIFGTFKNFIKEKKFEVLIPIFEYFFTAMGYGRLSDTAAAYGLMVCTPDTVQTMINRIDGNTTIKGYKFNHRGFQSLLRTIIARESLQVNTSSKVYKLTRNPLNIKLQIRESGNMLKERNFDFVIWSANLRKSMKYWSNPTRKEYQVFLRPSIRYAVKTLVNAADQRLSNSPINFMIDPQDKHMTSAFDTFAATNAYVQSMYNRRILSTGNDGNKTITTAVYSQYTDSKPSENEMNNILRQELTQLGAKSIFIQATKIWSFFPHYYHRDLTNDMLYSILKMQGKNKMWYIGASVSFNSISGVVEYNKLLVSKMRAPVV